MRGARHEEPHAAGLLSMGVSPGATSDLAAEHIRFVHSDGRGAPHLGVGFPCGILRGPTLAWTVLGGSAASLVNEGPTAF